MTDHVSHLVAPECLTCGQLRYAVICMVVLERLCVQESWQCDKSCESCGCSRLLLACGQLRYGGMCIVVLERVRCPAAMLS